MKELLIVIDMQKDFLTGALANVNEKSVTKNVKNKIEEWRNANKEIVFTRDTHDNNYMQTQEGKRLPVPHCIKDTDGWQIVDGLTNGTETVFDKPTFGSIELAKYVRNGGYERVELVGVCTDICVVSNAILIKAFCPETIVAVDGNCCAGVTQESHEAALATMSACQIELV